MNSDMCSLNNRALSSVAVIPPATECNAAVISTISPGNCPSGLHLKDLFFDDFMKRGLTVMLLHQIEAEYGLYRLQEHDIKDRPIVKFLSRYYEVSTTRLLEHLQAVCKNGYGDEKYSIATFSSKFMHDLNLWCSENGIFTDNTHNVMGDYIMQLECFIRSNIHLCRSIGMQHDKRNLPGLYYKLFMVHLSVLNKTGEERASCRGNINSSSCLDTNFIHYPDDLFQNMTLIILFALIHVEHPVQQLALLLFSQYILRVIATTKITVGQHNAAHIAVMCNDLPATIGLMNRQELWHEEDIHGLLPVENAMLAMFYCKTELDMGPVQEEFQRIASYNIRSYILIFVVACIKSDITGKQTKQEALYQKRYNFIHDIFNHVMCIDRETELDIYDLGFLDIYGDIWNHTDIISKIPKSISLPFSVHKKFFYNLNKIYHDMCNCLPHNTQLLEHISCNFMDADMQRYTHLLKEQFTTLASLPMVLEDAKGLISFGSYYGLPRALVYKDSTHSDDQLVVEECFQSVSIGDPMYAAVFFPWNLLFAKLANTYDYTPYSASVLNDHNSFYAYGALLRLFVTHFDIEALVMFLKDKLKTVGGNGKSQKRRHKHSV